MLIDDVRDIPLFEGLSDEQLGRLLLDAETVEIAPGVVYWQEGDPADHWWVLVDGGLDLLRWVDRERTVVGRMDVPGRWAGGFRAWDEHGAYLAGARGAQPGRLLKIPSSTLRARMQEWLPLAGHLVNGLYGTARSIESTVRQRESLVTLGTLAAGLAHELNNPAAAAARSAEALAETCEAVLSSLGRMAEGQLTAEQFLALDGLRRSIGPPSPHRSPLARADEEDALAGWLERHGIEQPWTLAPTLAAAGVDLGWCERAAALLPGRALGPGLDWVGGMLAMGDLISGVREATGRVSELVAAVRSYTQLDRAPRQPVDVTEGLESTLVMLAHKLGDRVTVVRDYSPDLPSVDGRPGELNQVWTNLVDNAVDAMAGEGTLRLVVRADERSLVVEVRDTGPGLSEGVAERAFDAFFTTKDVGHGTGLGLDIARRVVVDRHRGDITIEREGDETVLRVSLPR